MIWFFRRGDELTTCQLRADPTRPGYDFIVTQASGEETVEHFELSRDATVCWTQLETRLHQEGWSGPHGT